MINYRNIRKSPGFTTIEMALVILISGLLFVMLMNLYGNFNSRQNYYTTVDNADEIDKVLTGFFSIYGRYPCPADPTLAPNHPDYGRALDCGPTSIGACSATNVPRLFDNSQSNIICSNVGSREVIPGMGQAYVLTGILPFNTLAADPNLQSIFKEYSSRDGYNMRFTYAVTEVMADTALSIFAPAGPNWGAISLYDENGEMITAPPSNIHYALISHGPNTRGAYNDQGIMAEGCAISGVTTPPGLDDPDDPVYGGSMNPELENCDYNDAIFRSSLLSLSEGTSYFDDFVYYRNNISSEIWTRSVDSGPAIYLYNNNIGNVGVGTQTPVAALDVVGDLNAEQATHAGDGYCDRTRPTSSLTDGDSECFQTSVISEPIDPAQSSPSGDLEKVCGTGRVAVGFERNRLICEALINPSTPPATTSPCPPDGAGLPQFARGIRYNRADNTFQLFGCGRPAP